MAKTKKTTPTPTLVVKAAATQPVHAVPQRGLTKHPGMAVNDMLAIRLGNDGEVRLPDENGDLSCTTVLRDEFTVSSDPLGFCAIIISPAITGYKATPAITAGVLPASIASTAHPQSTSFTNEARYARTVCMKIEVNYIGRADAAAGYLSFSEKSNIGDVQSATIDALHVGSAHQARVEDGLLAFVDFTQSPRWESPTAGTFMAATFPLAVIAMTGAVPGTATLRVRVSHFMEYLPVEGSLSEGSMGGEPNDPAALAVWGALNVPSTSVTTAKNRENFYKRVREVANAAYHIAQPLAPYAVGAAKLLLREAMAAPPMLLLN